MRKPEEVLTGKTIAFVSNNAWSVFNFRLDVIKWLLAANARVVVLTPADEYVSRLLDSGCEYVEINFNNKSENPFSDIRFYYRLKKIYAQLQPDFIFHYVAKPNIYGSMAAAANNIPSVAVITGLGYPFARRDMLFYIIRYLYRRALRRVYQVWFLNNDDAKIFVDEKIVHVDQTRVLPGEGVNTGHFHPVARTHSASRPFRFLMCTRLLKSKGVSIYADAARVLRNKKYQEATFALLGFYEKSHPDSISPEEIARWQQDDLITFLGFDEDVRPHLAEADCVVFPSYYNEGVPRCLMEAASMEVAAITSLNRGCRDVVADGITGYLSRMHDPFDLADKMEKIMRLPADERIRMGRRGRELVVQKFDVSKIIEVYANTLISAFENKHGSYR